MKKISILFFIISSTYLLADEISFNELFEFTWSVHYKDIYGDPLYDVDLLLNFDEEKNIFIASEFMNNKSMTTNYNYIIKNKVQLWIYFQNPELPRYIIEKVIDGWIIYSPNTDTYGFKELKKVEDEIK